MHLHCLFSDKNSEYRSVKQIETGSQPLFLLLMWSKNGFHVPKQVHSTIKGKG